MVKQCNLSNMFQQHRAEVSVSICLLVSGSRLIIDYVLAGRTPQKQHPMLLKSTS